MNCKECHRSFDCSLDENCWCFAFPKILQTSIANQCLCPECLLIDISNRINEGSFEPDAEDRKWIAELGVSKKLQEEIDYYFNEDRNFVFTKWYHLRKGYCCNNSCIHCPYKND